MCGVYFSMKTKIIFGLLLAVSFVSITIQSGCAGCANDLKQLHAVTTGLHKRITLYGSSGIPIRSWETTTATQDKGGTCFFLSKDGKAVTISGSFVIEEI